MRRGTTPTHIFKTDVDLTDASVIYVTYRQNRKTIIEKTKDDLTKLTESEFRLELTQTETLNFTPTGQVEIQIRARFPDGSAIASQVMRTAAQIILKEGVI